MELPDSAELRDLEADDPGAASVWHEVRADALHAAGDAEQCRFALSAAARYSTGVRRATLLRRLADAQVLAGQPDAAIVTLQPIGSAIGAMQLPDGPNAEEAIDALSAERPACDCWETLSSDAALALAELTRAEALSHLVRSDEAVRAFNEVEPRLKKLEGAIAADAWVRWATAQTWFLCEIRGDATAAVAVCARVRQQVPAELLQREVQALALLRAEEVAASSIGDFARAKTIVEEHIALAVQCDNPREECLARNARGLSHLNDGELNEARTSFERSRALAVAAKWVRREAIATHNLALVACERLELELAEALEQRYAALSLEIGNEAARAEAPLMLATIELARGALDIADALITTAHRVSESQGWSMLTVQASALAGRSCLVQFVRDHDALELPRARAHFVTALDVLEQHSLAWSEELDPGETYALLALACARSGDLDKAHEALARGDRRIGPQSVVARHALALGSAAVRGEGLAQALAWFDERGHRRVTALWRTIAATASR